MTAYNVVRFRVKPGNEEAFIEAHRRMGPSFKGFITGNLIRTGDRTFCLVAEWRNFQSIVNARPQMISMLDQVRGFLEDLGSDLGVTDPISGESVIKFGPPKKAAKKAAKQSAAKRGGAKKRATKRTKAKPAARKSTPKKRKR